MRKTKSPKETAASLESCPPRCRRIFNRLSAYLDGEIASEQCAEIRRHLRGCQNCGTFFSTLKKTVELCRESRPPLLSRRNRKKTLGHIMKKMSGA